MGKGTVLVIEDEAAIRRGVCDALKFEGYQVLEAARGEEGMALALKSACDLILLDLLLPGPDGFTILAEVRRGRPTLPVIILTARGEEKDRVKGLKLGADDYVVKPFGLAELLARVEAVLRRSPERPLDVTEIEFSGGAADLATREVKFEDGTKRELSEREAEILRYFFINRGRPVSRDELLSRVWRLNPRAIVETRTIDMHVARLREKLRDDPAAPRVIQTVRGKGYIFKGRED